MADENQTLARTTGGEAAVDAAVERFYGKVLSDANLAPFFDGLDIATPIVRWARPMPRRARTVFVAQFVADIASPRQTRVPL